MRARPVAIDFFCLLLGLLSGCATAHRTPCEKLTVVSTPAGAHVELSNGFSGETPVTFVVPRQGDLVVRITKPGYEPMVIHSRCQASAGAAFGSVAGSSAAGAGAGGMVAADIVAQTGAIGAGVATSAAAYVAAPFVAVGTVKDASSGALLDHAPNPIVVQLQPGTGQRESADGGSAPPWKPPSLASAPSGHRISFRAESLPARGSYPKIPGRVLIVMSDDDVGWVCAARPASGLDPGGKYFNVEVGEITRQAALRAFANKFACAESCSSGHAPVTGDVLFVRPRVRQFQFVLKETKLVLPYFVGSDEQSAVVAIQAGVDFLAPDGALLLSRTYGKADAIEALTRADSPGTEGRTNGRWFNWARLVSDEFHGRLYTLLTYAAQDAERLVHGAAR